MKISAVFFFIALLISCGKEEVDSDHNLPNPKPSHSHFLADSSTQASYKVKTFALTELAILSSDENNSELSKDKLIFYTSYPLKLRFSIKASGEPFKTIIYFGLMEKPSTQPNVTELRNLHTCPLGSMPISHGGSNEQDEAVINSYVVEFIISKQCLPSGKSLTYNIFAAIDQNAELNFLEPIWSPGTVIVYNTYEQAQKLNQDCTDITGNIGCVYDITIKEANSLNVKLTDFSSESSIGILRPSLLANESPIVSPEEDEYDTPFMRAVTTISLYGIPSEQEDGLESDKTIWLRYEICPITNLSDNECYNETWLPLHIFDPSKPNEPIGHLNEIAIDKLRAGEPNHFSNDLYVEENLYNIMTQGIWRNYVYFKVRSCLITNFSEQENETTPSLSDNCKQISIKVVQLRSEPANTGDRDFSLGRIWRNFFGSKKNLAIEGEISTEAFIDKDNGSNFSLKVGVVSAGWINLELLAIQLLSTAYVDPSKKSGTSLKMLLFGLPILYLAKPQASDTASQTPQVSDLNKDGVIEKISQIFKEYCTAPIIFIPGTPFNLTLCLKNSIGFDINFGAITKTIKPGENSLFPSASKIGGIMGSFSPNISMTAGMEIGSNIGNLVKAGVKGSASVLKIALPVTPYLFWGRIEEDKKLTFKLLFDTTLSLTSLDGSFGLQIPLPTVQACLYKTGFGLPLPYPCNPQYENLYIPIVKWNGVSYHINLLKRTVPLLTLN